ncbi:hypothetical protein NPS01_33900 [Nocardioides psychrotolerans]|uniref:Preprotein translocase subunit SecD n=1 Tax=Nocardioides psychrotolerans TaxID=1005945 RepID=A0A1I3PPL1_9ACTN|nr:hypothetical protein [Nocardioides psychrotolerans]GEP39727.1 hypothetical protein NPS01_33900 [Nocardioides psychrotolerans]SFJ23247.1 preprotein translocase subunit SecD [Nocardioides psychrotolerans]
MRLRPLVLGFLLVATLAGCGEESPAAGPEAEPSATTASAEPGASLEVRAVIATSQAPAPDSLVKQQFDALDCAAAPVPVPTAEPGAACDAAGTKYSLGPAVVVGGIEDAEAGQPEGSDLWVVAVDLEAGASEALDDLTSELAPISGRIALVVDGAVISAPTVQTPITDGRLQIAGDFDEESATALAEGLSRE